MLTSSRTTNILLVVVIAFGIGIVAMLASGVRGGPLDPPGPPASTMKTLDQIPGSWSRPLAANDGPDTCHSSRFLCVLNFDAAVLDRETGLVWERVPNIIGGSAPTTWATARNNCRNYSVAGRLGWRMPSEEELGSLLGASMPGHPFTFTIGSGYWTATTLPDAPTMATSMFIATADGFASASYTFKSDTRLRWCVRGGAAEDNM